MTTETKRTYITGDQIESYLSRSDFVGVHQYGTVKPEPNEIGAVVEAIGIPQLHEIGLWEIPCNFIERIFIGEDPKTDERRHYCREE